MPVVFNWDVISEEQEAVLGREKVLTEGRKARRTDSRGAGWQAGENR